MSAPLNTNGGHSAPTPPPWQAIAVLLTPIWIIAATALHALITGELSL